MSLVTRDKFAVGEHIKSITVQRLMRNSHKVINVEIHHSSGSLVGLVATKLYACWEVLVRTWFESRWGQISVAVPAVYLAMLNL